MLTEVQEQIGKVKKMANEDYWRTTQKIHYVGEVIVTDSGISRIIEFGDYNGYTAEQILPKSAFVEAFNKFIGSGERETAALSTIERLYKKGYINNAERGVLRRSILLPAEKHHTPTFNRKTLEKALDYWYDHQEVGNREQNAAVLCAINAIKYCIEHDSGYQEGAT
jgi:hypothetical protein